MKKYIIIGCILLIIIGTIIFLILKNRKKDFMEYPQKDPNIYEENDFNLKLLKTVNSTQEHNYLISPYSIEIALNMVKEGSNGNTLKEINKVLPTRKITYLTAKERIGVANAIFLKDKYSDYIEKDFMTSLKENYQAEVIVDKFTSPNKINDWVNKNTYKMIPRILNEMDANFVLGLANAIAIDVKWLSPFECSLTKEEEFTKANQETMKVEMMHKYVEERASYFTTKNAEGIILPYEQYDEKGEKSYKEGVQLEFVGILPKEDAFSYVENLTINELQEIDKNNQSIDDDLNVRLSLPAFEYAFNLTKFKEVLMSMGLKSMFSKEQADFTNIISRENLTALGSENLYMNAAIHKTYIKLNETGTKAAAVTYFGFKDATAIMKQPKIVTLNFNKSFAYMIRDSKTKEILFFGVVNEPNKWEKKTCKD